MHHWEVLKVRCWARFKTVGWVGGYNSIEGRLKHVLAHASLVKLTRRLELKAGSAVFSEKSIVERSRKSNPQLSFRASQPVWFTQICCKKITSDIVSLHCREDGNQCVDILLACKYINWAYRHHCWSIIYVFRARIYAWFSPQGVYQEILFLGQYFPIHSLGSRDCIGWYGSCWSYHLIPRNPCNEYWHLTVLKSNSSLIMMREWPESPG